MVNQLDCETDFGFFINVMYRHDNPEKLESIRTKILSITEWTDTQKMLCSWLYHCVRFSEFQLVEFLLKFVDSAKWNNQMPPDRNFNHPIVHEAVEQCQSENGMKILHSLWTNENWKPFLGGEKSKKYVDKYNYTVKERLDRRVNYWGVTEKYREELSTLDQ